MFRKKSSLSLATILLVLSTMLVLRVKASSQTYWEAPLPHEDALLNQTLTTYKHDNYAEVGLSANLYVLQKDYPQPGQYELALAVVVAANSRYNQGYTASYETNAINIWNEKILTLGDDEGTWVDMGIWFNYYGAWYRKIFVSSNGFAVLDGRAYNDNDVKWTSPTPKAIPSTDDPNILIAPFWRDLDPSKGGTIKVGDGPSGSFVVAWIGVPNKANTNTQTFAINFYPDFGGHLSFIYHSITNDVITSIGIEDQTGKSGLSIPSVSSWQAIRFDQNSPGNFIRISQIKVSASKLTDSGANDDNAVIHIDGLNNTLPGGVNVELYDPSEGQYGSWPIVSAAKFVLSTAALASGNAWLGVVGWVVSAASLVQELSPMPSSTVHEADQATETAYIFNLARDETRPVQTPYAAYPWDVSVYALFRWRLLSSSLNHMLVLNAQVDYAGETFTIVTDNLELKLTPGDISWYGRTNPDAHYYNFYQISTPYGPSYHIDTIGSNDYGYHMLGWSKLTDDSPEDYKVRPDGTIRVEGYFRQSDTFSSSDQPGRRLVNVYVMYSENINDIVQTAQVLDYTDGTDWKYKSVVIGRLTHGKTVKIGVGRPDAWYADWNLVAEWAGINVYDDNSFRLSISASSGGTTNPAPGTYTYGYGSPVTVTATAYTYYAFDHWVLDGATIYGNPITVTMNSDHSLTAYFYYTGGGGGGGCPYVSAWDGSGYVLDNNLLSASESSGRSDVTDYYLLQQMLAQREDGTYALLLSEFESEHDFFDRVQLIAVDHPSSLNVAVSPYGEILMYTNPYPPVSAITNDDKNVKKLLSKVDGSYYQGYNGSYITLNFGDLDVSQGAKLVIRSDMLLLKSPVYIQTLGSLGEWRTVATIFTRTYWSTDIIDMSKHLPDARGNLKLRLYFVSNDKIDFVGLDTSPQAKINVQEGQLLSAVHSTDGDVTTKLLYIDQTYAELMPGQEIQLSFTLPTQTMEARNYIIIAEGRYYTATP